MILPPPVPPFLTYFPIVVRQPGRAGGNLAQDADDYSDPSCNNCHIPSLPPPSTLPPPTATGQLVLSCYLKINWVQILKSSDTTSNLASTKLNITSR